ncbi:MAG: hypothetical protein DRI57_15140, partial [Deltaproteobacteria bacterium]
MGSGHSKYLTLNGIAAYFAFKSGLYCSFWGQKGQYRKNSESCNALSDAEKSATQALKTPVFGSVSLTFQYFGVVRPHKPTDIYDLYPVFGTVSDPGGVTYKLQCREKGASSWITFEENSGASFSGELGVFDPTVLRNGVHEIRLHAEDSAGNVSAEVFPVIVDGGLKVGQVTIPAADVSLPAPGFPLSLSRQYDSRAQTPGDFG